jgi:hypothetical protein
LDRRILFSTLPFGAEQLGQSRTSAETREEDLIEGQRTGRRDCSFYSFCASM